ncbi:hypothetical protein Pmani_031225 [Petrolisthes manimaculis]|uniref:Uncharacterized protein n=1 Tax=Petrolisthes manimaculis TaxID=1843537 RepID=A0AAE1TV40_9EUCA|nr:hypothetical protein Pmani_031225 [Petrolisthes manimaculis]
MTERWTDGGHNIKVDDDAMLIQYTRQAETHSHIQPQMLRRLANGGSDIEVDNGDDCNVGGCCARFTSPPTNSKLL